MSIENGDRRKYLRFESSVNAKIITDKDVICPRVKNFSPIGIRFNTDTPIGENADFEISLQLPEAKNPVHIQCKSIWQKEENEQEKKYFDIGAKFVTIEEDNKNTFLKVLCDLLYGKKVL
ncbi:MAG: PilZ domain-containing protein [Candidatus Omnitrophica bacterium]|nr:PilZ domain-containing protein [Candidatus Omnitrophota bacterium]